MDTEQSKGSSYIEGHSDRNYLSILNHSSNAAFIIVIKVFFPEVEVDEFLTESFKSTTEIVEVLAKNTAPINKLMGSLVDGMEAEQKAVLNAVQSSLKMCATNQSITQADRDFFLEDALEKLVSVYHTLEHVPHMSRNKAETAKYIALTHMAMGQYQTARAWLETSRKDHQEVLNIPLNDFGFFESLAKNRSGFFEIRSSGSHSSSPAIATGGILIFVGVVTGNPILIGAGVATIGSQITVDVSDIATSKSVEIKEAANNFLLAEKEQSRQALLELDNIIALF